MADIIVIVLGSSSSDLGGSWVDIFLGTLVNQQDECRAAALSRADHVGMVSRGIIGSCCHKYISRDIYLLWFVIF